MWTERCLLHVTFHRSQVQVTVLLTFNPLSPDENEISLYMITTCLNIQVTRIKEVITEDKMP